MANNKLAKPERKLIAQYLKGQFPWLGEDVLEEYPDSGADVIEQLEMIYFTLSGK